VSEIRHKKRYHESSMLLDPPGVEPLDEFALVVYIPDPLGRFLDDFRRLLVPPCKPHAHVSVLPPRPLAGPAIAAGEQIWEIGRDFAPFDVELGQVAVFPQTGVLYLEVRHGAERLAELHHALNRSALHFEEPHRYHPHVTLAQDFDVKDLDALKAMAEAKWAGFDGPRRFRAETLTFVQNTRCAGWADLAQISLGAVPVG
jgi:2'-5' RNA ligase superfamily